MASRAPRSHSLPEQPLQAGAVFLSFLKEKIDLENPSPDLFDQVAEHIAKTLVSGKSNKSTQIRRFYDEMLRFQALLRNASGEQFAKTLPFIRMINARAAYASQRKNEKEPLVDGNFTAFLREVLGQVKDCRTLDNGCTLFEAVIGFSPRDKGNHA